jgi:hypothetical protein
MRVDKGMLVIQLDRCFHLREEDISGQFVEGVFAARRHCIQREQFMNIWKCSTVALIIVLGCVVSRGAIQSASAEPQPHMKVALKHLEHAKVALEKATADKGGHRVKALELTEQAIAQVQEGVAYDNKH